MIICLSDDQPQESGSLSNIILTVGSPVMLYMKPNGQQKLLPLGFERFDRMDIGRYAVGQQLNSGRSSAPVRPFEGQDSAWPGRCIQGLRDTLPANQRRTPGDEVEVPRGDARLSRSNISYRRKSKDQRMPPRVGHNLYFCPFNQ